MIVIQYHVRKYHLLTFSRYEILGQKQIEVSVLLVFASYISRHSYASNDLP